MKRHVDPLLAAAAIDDRGGADHGRARLHVRRRCVSCVEPPVVTTSSTTRTFSPGYERKAAPQRQRAVLPLREDRADAERARRLPGR